MLNAHRHLPGDLYDSYYHWHDNRRRHRYRQPLRRLQHGHRSTLPGERIRHSGFSGGCRVERRPTVHRPPSEKLFYVLAVRAGESGSGVHGPFLNTFFPNYADLITDANLGSLPRLRYLYPDAGNCAQPAVRHQVEDHLLHSPPGPGHAEFEVY